MKPTELIIDQRVNEAIWARGIQKPPRKIRVRMEKDGDGVVTVYLAEGGELE
jgi:large subunit ribosomal protein L31e